MENNNFFFVINRINSILFLILLLVGLTGSFFLVQELTQKTRRNSVEIKLQNNNSKEIIELSDVEKVRGLDIQYLRVYSRKGGVLASGGYSRTLRNLLFLSLSGDEPTWLLPNNDSKIIRNHQLTHRADEEMITDFFYIEVNSENEGIKIGISSPEGSNLKYIDLNINKVIEHEYYPKNKSLGVLLQTGNELRYRVYDLRLLKKLSDKFVIKL